MDAEKFVPGHGDVSGKSCLGPMAEAVQYWMDAVKPFVDKGASLEETLEKVSVAEKYPMAKAPFLREMVRNSIADLYRSLKS
jgi:hypothetical protein